MSTSESERLGKALFESVELDGKLIIKVFRNSVDSGAESVSCWTFVTSGLTALGQKELIFVLRRLPNEDESGPPWEIRSIFTSIFSLAQNKQFVDVADWSFFKNEEEKLFGHSDLIGFAYSRPINLPGVDMPDPDSSLLAILLVPGEPEYVGKFGTYRITSRLGRITSYFPTPPWSDRLRESVITTDDWQKSLLPTVNIFDLRKSSLCLPYQGFETLQNAGEKSSVEGPGGVITLNISPDSVSAFDDYLKVMGKTPDKVVAIVLAPDENSNMRLVWYHDDTAPFMIVPADVATNSVTAGFLVLAVVDGPKIEPDGIFTEDGMSFAMPTHIWSKLYASLKQKKDVEIPASRPGGLGLAIRFPSKRTFLDSEIPRWWQLIVGFACLPLSAILTLGAFSFFALIVKGTDQGWSPYVAFTVFAALSVFFAMISYRLILARPRSQNGGLLSPAFVIAFGLFMIVMSILITIDGQGEFYKLIPIFLFGLAAVFSGVSWRKRSIKPKGDNSRR